VTCVPGFASVIVDVDSTLCAIEGIDWLALRRGPAVGRAVADLTDQAMRGEIALDTVYGARLDLVRPTVADVTALADAYVASVAPGAADAIARLHAAGRRVVLVSGGLRDAIIPVARLVGIPASDVHAVAILRDGEGRFLSHDEASPLARATGKADVARSLALPPRVLAVGDGATDAAMRGAVDAFAAFTGFVSRAAVVAAADAVVSSFATLTELVLA
jgi:phosphoserine phosphatase